MMMVKEQNDTGFPPTSAPNEKLPYRIELWDATKTDTVERLLARAVSAQLARAIFKAVITEHPGRRITLQRGSRVIADSTKL